MRVVVVGAGAWGTAFSKVLRERGHDVFVARRATIDDAPYEEADLVVLAVPSHSFREAVARARGHAKVEISGGVTLERIPQLAATGADYVSAGALTHSAPAVDISFEIEPL